MPFWNNALYIMDFAAQQSQSVRYEILPDTPEFRPTSAFHKFAIVVFLGQFVATEKQEG